jgi:hypothetical protein
LIYSYLSNISHLLLTCSRSIQNFCLSIVESRGIPKTARRTNRCCHCVRLGCLLKWSCTTVFLYISPCSSPSAPVLHAILALNALSMRSGCFRSKWYETDLRSIPHHIHFYTEAAGNRSVPGDDNGMRSPIKNLGETRRRHAVNRLSDIVLQILVSRRQP